MSEVADSALRDLQAVATGAAATDDENIPVAGTVVLLRDHATGMQVLLMRRPDRGSFPGAWVFPGGRIEPADLRDGAAEVDDARRAGARETAEEVGVHVDAGALHPFSCWEPPAGIPKRVRTWFFLATLAQDTRLQTSAAEVAEVAWMRPDDALRRHADGALTLYPPTWMTLAHLADDTEIAAALARADAAPPRRYRTVIRHDAGGAVFVWQPDAAWDPAVSLDVAGPRHRLHTANLPWRLEKG